MARLLIEDVTMTKGQEIALGVRLRGGATLQLTLPRELPAPDRFRTPDPVVAEVDTLLDTHTDAQVAAMLHARGRQPLRGGTYGAQHVARIRRTYQLRSRRERLRARGMLSLAEMAARLGVATATVKRWHSSGRLVAHLCNDKGERMFEWPREPPQLYSRAPKASANSQPPSSSPESLSPGAV